MKHLARGITTTVCLCVCFWLGGQAALAQSGSGVSFVPPPEPAVAPIIVHPDESDRDVSRVDDELESRIQTLRTAVGKEREASKRTALQVSLTERIRIELVFSRQITQQQIDDFLALGGEIEYIYRAVSYGWNGTIPLDAVDAVPAAMGNSLVAVIMDRPVHATLDEATQCGRVRPIWASGFAGTGGLGGDSNTTIAIIDSGVDDSHPDTNAARKEYWKDWTDGNVANPEDKCGHGEHVASIALGTGISGGVSGALYYTDQDDGRRWWGDPADKQYLAAGQFFASPIHITNVQNTTFTSVATWIGGGQTNLYGDWRLNGDTGGWTSISAPTFGLSPLTESNLFNSGTNQYTAALAQNAALSVNAYVIKNSVTNYPASSDGRSRFLGVVPGCQWAGVKVLGTDGTGTSADVCEGVDDVVAQRVAHKIKVANMSIGWDGSPGINTTLRAKVNTAVNNGVLMTISAGNDGPGTAGANQIDDPGRAALAITVAASNDINQLTKYTSSGFTSPGSDEDNKPDVMAPGGSEYYSYILAADTNDGDQHNTFADQQANDYRGMFGTSMAAPFVAGSAALVIQALESAGLTWDFYSSASALKVKMLLCATATESNQNREVSSGTNPSLGRAANPKDLYEGYGIVNPDAAVEAALLTYYSGTLTELTNGGNYDRRAWARKVNLGAGYQATLNLDVPATGDFDLYLYSSTPDAKGNPQILASSASAGNGTDESISYLPAASGQAYLVIKRVAGTGTWTLTGTTDPNAPNPGTATSPQYDRTWPITVSYSGAADVGPSGLKKVELWVRWGEHGAWSYSGLSSASGSGTFNYNGGNEGPWYFDLVAEDYAGNRSAYPSGYGDCTTIFDSVGPRAPGRPTGPGAYTGSTSVTFNWTAAADDMTGEEGSGVAGYCCKIGASPGSADFFSGDVGTDLHKTISGEYGSGYYCGAQAYDRAGNYGAWSDWSTGTSVVQNPDLTVAQAKQMANGATVGVQSAIITALNGYEITIRQPDGSCGITAGAFNASEELAAGMNVQVGGTMSTLASGQKVIDAATFAATGDSSTLTPVGLNNRALGGGDWFFSAITGAGQGAAPGGVGLNNVGLLVRTWGTVTQVGPDYIYLNDGSDLRDGSYTGEDENAGVRVTCEPTTCLPGDHVAVTGKSSIFQSGEVTGRCVESSDLALRFDGDDLVRVPDSESLDPVTLTAECWVKLGRLASGSGENSTDFQVLVSKGSVWSDGGYGLFQWGYEEEPGNAYYGFGFCVDGLWVTGWYPLETNRWYHVAGTYDGSALKLYVDGANIQAQYISDLSIDTTAPLYFGCEQWQDYAYYLTGELDEVRILGYAATENETRETMHWSLGWWENACGVWRFNELMADPYVLDATWSQNTGTLGPDLTTDHDPVRALSTAPVRKGGGI